MLFRSEVMPTFDKKKFAKFLTDNVSPAPFGVGMCARYVRHALAAAGVSPATWPVAAKDWGPSLTNIGFKEFAKDGYLAVGGAFNACGTEPFVPALGDVVVMQGTSTSTHGHMAGHTGTAWVSDFVQRELWPGPGYRKEKPAYVVYRWAD